MKPNEEYWLNLYKKGLIEVDPETGFVCSWLSNSKDGRKKKNKKQIGASNRSKDNWYIHLSAGPSRKERYQILAHRFVWIIFNGDIPDRLEINHINGIKNDNRLCNLREITQQQNCQNQRTPPSHNTSGFMGVSYYKAGNKYAAHINLDGKKKHLGYFNDPKIAYQAYLTAKRKLHSSCSI